MKNRIKNLSDTNLLLSITVIVFVLMYAGAMLFLGEGFLKPQTFFNILNAQAALIITACGLSLVMITGGIDISVGGVVALVSMCCAVYLDYQDGNVFGAILISLGIGIAFGLVQGFLVAYLDIQPFIVTLAGMFFARGMTTIVHTNPFNVANEDFVALKMTRIPVPGMGSVNKLGKYVNAYVEIGVIVAILVVILLFCVLRWTKFGRGFYAVGGNQQSALMLGINVKRQRFMAQLLCGVLAGGKCHWNPVRRALPEHYSEYRLLRRSRSGMVDRHYHRGYAVFVPGHPERGHGAKKEKILNSFHITHILGKAVAFTI